MPNDWDDSLNQIKFERQQTDPTKLSKCSGVNSMNASLMTAVYETEWSLKVTRSLSSPCDRQI